MKENISKIIDKLKEVFNNIKDKLDKIDFLKKVVTIAKANRLVLSLVFFCVCILTLVLIATLGLGEFVVPVCVLMIIEVAMAVLLHRSELWIHAILMALQVVVGIVIDRVPLTILCVIAYVITTITLQLAFKRATVTVEENKKEKKKRVKVKKEEETATEETVEEEVAEKEDTEEKKTSKKGKKNK